MHKPCIRRKILGMVKENNVEFLEILLLQTTSDTAIA